MQRCYFVWFRKCSTMLQNRSNITFQRFLCIFNNFKLSIALRKTTVQIRKFTPVAAIFKMADCRINNIHKYYSWQTYACPCFCFTLAPLSLRSRFLIPFSYLRHALAAILSDYPFLEYDGCLLFCPAPSHFSAKEQKVLCLS